MIASRFVGCSGSAFAHSFEIMVLCLPGRFQQVKSGWEAWMQMDERKNKGGKAALRRIKEHQKENGRGRLEEKKQRGERK